MAADMTIEEHILRHFGGFEQNSLLHLLNEEHSHDLEQGMLDVLQLSPYTDEYSLTSVIKFKQHDFKIISLNCQSLSAKIDNLKILIHNLDNQQVYIDAICLQESWLSDLSDLSLLHVEGYQLISMAKHCSAHSGLVIYLSNKYQHEVLNIHEQSNLWDGQFIKISGMLHNRNIILGNIYRPPNDINENYKTFFDELIRILAILNKSKHEVIIAGDFNIDLLKVNTNMHAHEFFHTLIAQSFIPKITLPTRFSDLRCTLIDNFLCKLSPAILDSSAAIFTNNISDHQLYILVVPNLSNTIKVPKYTNILWDANSTPNFKADISKANVFAKLNPDISANPNENYDILEKIIVHNINKHFPRRQVKFNKYKHKKNTWITKGILHSIKFRDNLYRELKKACPNSDIYSTIKVNLRTYNKILKRNILLAKQMHYKIKFDKYKNDIKGTWGVIRDILNKTHGKKDYPEQFNLNGVHESNRIIIANNFNEYFTNIGEELASKITDPVGKSHTDYLHSPCESRLNFTTVNENVVAKIIESLKTKSSCGDDGLSTKLLKEIKNETCSSITLIVNQMITTGIFPDSLKIAKIIPIFKKGDIEIIENYRPISILPAISKIFEKILSLQIHEYFQSKHLYYEYQYGFIKNRSTEQAALELIDIVITEIDKGEIPFNIYIDLSKAFDTLDHAILMDKLYYYGVQGTSLDLLRNYLVKRKQYVQIGEVKSDITYLSTGVPQGSILGPLLFIIYINDIAKCSNLLHTIIYADDTTLMGNISTFELRNGRTLDENINFELLKLTDWLKVNKLSLNANKTKLMIFHMPQRKLNPPIIKIDEIQLEPISNFNFLGIIINENINWSKHINKISYSISKTIGIIRKLKNVLPSSVLLTIYNSLILPQLTYGILVWGYESNCIFKLQKMALRAMTSSKYNAHTNPLFKKMHLLKVGDIHTVQQLKFFYKLTQNNLPAYFNSFLIRRQHNIHEHLTRNRHMLVTEKVHHKFAEKCIRYSVFKTVNDTPTQIIDKMYTHSLQGVANYSKNLLINEYDVRCYIRDCYICK